MFVDVALAARIDQVEARLSRAVADGARGRGAPGLTVPIGGGVAVLARPGSPVNKVIGAGFAGPLPSAELAALTGAWAAHGEIVRVELATLADPAALAGLGEHGFRTVGFEHVLVRPLAGSLPGPAAHVAITVDAHDEAWRATSVDGFTAADGTGAAVDDHGRDVLDAVMRDFASAAGFRRYVARLDGEVAGAATLRLDDGVALLCGATTLPAHRRRGVQAALLAARLADARAAGCEVAVVTTAPGSQSQANVLRGGFALGYARAILLGPPLAA